MSADDMKCLAQEFRADLDAQLAGDGAAANSICPGVRRWRLICRRYLEILFPIYYLCGEREVPGTLRLSPPDRDPNPALEPDLQRGAV